MYFNPTTSLMISLFPSLTADVFVLLHSPQPLILTSTSYSLSALSPKWASSGVIVCVENTVIGLGLCETKRLQLILVHPVSSCV